MKITINNEEVLCNKDFTINEEMLNTSSVILNNVYPVEWEQDKDYTSRFYYPKDYSKCKIFDEIEHPSTREDAEGTSFSINVDTTKQYQVQTLKGQTTQSGTPTPSSPQPINITTGRQVVSVCGKNLFNKDNITNTLFYDVNDGHIISSSLWSQSQFIAIDTTKKYTLQSSYTTLNNSFEITQFDINQNWIKGQQASMGNGYFVIGTDITFNSNTKYIKIGFRNDRVDTSTMMLEKGNTPSTYVEYKGNDYEINLGKNLFDDTTSTFFSPQNASCSVNNNVITMTTLRAVTSNELFFCTKIPDELLQNGETYTLSSVNVSGVVQSLQLQLRNKNGSNANKPVANSVVYDSNYSLYVRGNPYSTTGSTVIPIGTEAVVKNVQVEKGSVASSFTPYKTPIYLGKIGTYQDYIFKNTTENPLYDSNLEEGQWYIHKEIGKVVLNGSENWLFNNSYTYNVFYTPIDTLKKEMNVITTMSNYYKGVKNGGLADFGNTYNNSIAVRGYDDAYYHLYISNDAINSLADFKTWLGTHNTEVYYVLNTPTNTLIEDEELINQLNSIELLEGLNNVSVSSANLPFIMNLMYNYQEGYTEEELYFCGVVENTGNISLNPRHPHYCNLQVLDFKTFLSEGETLDIVIYEKTILEAIEQIIGVIAPYGFVKGNINIYHADEMIGAYSTKDKTAYDVFNYIADITQSRWTTRMVDENTIAIDFYDPNLMPQGTAIQYNNTWFTNNKIIDMNFNYSSRDYRNKQVMLSGEVYSNVETTEIMVADGYQTQFNTTGKIGYVSNVLLNGTPASIITKEEYDLGYDGDFIYQPGNTYFESENLIPNGAIITIVYYAIIEGREVLLNQDEIEKINTMTNRKGVVARYETRNDATTTKELNQIGQSYLKYKGMPEITLKVESLENIWNIGERVEFNSPLEELSTEYMVKKKTINYITTQDNLFYTFELSSNFNSETEINYFDNQRAKTIGNIGSGEFISRNIDIENTANVIFYGLEVNEVQISGESTLQSELQTPLGVE